MRLYEVRDDGKTLLVRSGVQVQPGEIEKLKQTVDEQKAKHGELNVIVEVH